jgi:hypothetical protein
MILSAIYPEKFEGEKGLNIMKVGLLVIVYQPRFILPLEHQLLILLSILTMFVMNPNSNFIFLTSFS